MNLKRNFDQYIEWYYDIEIPSNYLTQYLYINSKTKLDHYNDFFSLKTEDSFALEKEDLYGIYEVYEDFLSLNGLSFYEFFEENRIDIPNCLIGIKSLRRPINNKLFLKLSNYLMRGGKRLKSTKIILSVMFMLESNFYSLKNFTYKTEYSWRDYFLLLSSMKITYKSPSNLIYSTFDYSFSENLTTTYGNLLTTNYKDIVTNWGFKKILFRNLHKLLPIFAFYVYKVDKKKYKNSRGKSGKYTFIWKYVTSYKRIFLVMSWLMREVKVTQGRSILDRVFQVLRNFIFYPDKTWVFRVKKFSHNYIYRNARYTLADNYITVTN